MERTDNFDTGSDLTRSLELAQALIACGYDLGEVFVEG
jgi:hypothetical protein